MRVERDTPKALLDALLPLEEVHGFEFLDTWSWYEGCDKWGMRCRFHVFQNDGTVLGSATDWYVLAADVYPWGNISFYPAKDKGITETYKHQSVNHEGDAKVPWRKGLICVQTPERVIGRHGYDIEPHTVPDRLRWRCEKALSWIRAAYTDTLVISGEPFELPHTEDFCATSPKIVFSESNDSLQDWLKITDRVGDVSFLAIDEEKKRYATDAFHRLGSSVFYSPLFPGRIRSGATERCHGIWIRLDQGPCLPPWKIPETWGELRQACKAQGIDFNSEVRHGVKHLRDGKTHIILLGFPIPVKVGDPPDCMHFFAFQLPVLSSGNQTVNGFRANEQGQWLRDLREVIPDKERIRYLSTENWHRNQISTRGQLSTQLVGRKVAIIGCGALGAPLAELLVRGGVQDLVLVDGDCLATGNLVRHVLTLKDIDKGKAKSLSERLNLVSPHTEVRFVPYHFPPRDQQHIDLIAGADVILDCTANDDVLAELEKFPWNDQKFFLSLSVGFRAERFFAFAASVPAFPATRYRTDIQPWLEIEQEQHHGETFPREGIGCHHPVFPARADDMWLWASLAVKLLDRTCRDLPATPRLYVYEQVPDAMGVPEIRLAQKAAANE
jgi:hypothetical protein